MMEKPGLLTTEFWVTLLTNVVSLATGIGALLGAPIEDEPLLAIIPAAAFFASTLATAIYAMSRARTKQAEIATSVERNREQAAWDLAVLAEAPTITATTSGNTP